MPDRFRILVTGSRSWRDEQTIRDALASVVSVHGPENVTVVHGACPKGADAIADRIASEWGGGLTVERHPADWDAPCRPTCRHGYKIRADRTEYCSSAGVYRNQDMVDLGADVCLAFQVGNSRGTADCIRRAEKAGIPVRRYPRGTDV